MKVRYSVLEPLEDDEPNSKMQLRCNRFNEAKTEKLVLRKQKTVQRVKSTKIFQKFKVLNAKHSRGENPQKSNTERKQSKQKHNKKPQTSLTLTQAADK